MVVAIQTELGLPIKFVGLGARTFSLARLTWNS